MKFTLKNYELATRRLDRGRLYLQFSKLQCLCKLKECETHDFNCFIGGLRLDILENMDPFKDIFEAHREAIRVEYKLDRSLMRKSNSQKTIKAPNVEPVAEDVKLDIKKPEQEAEDFKATFGP
eukprot:TRINITY_DN10438_c0_g1_i1.p3 TRINITY_DN10438_c0_g1~~TRINITY_DN10438_c0_g1_i1.p3  ORF type:complete len:123 (+),score=22.70 TRINITY_DN10438_c0_g1_i1:172-540(+)